MFKKKDVFVKGKRVNRYGAWALKRKQNAHKLQTLTLLMKILGFQFIYSHPLFEGCNKLGELPQKKCTAVKAEILWHNNWSKMSELVFFIPLFCCNMSFAACDWSQRACLINWKIEHFHFTCHLLAKDTFDRFCRNYEK